MGISGIARCNPWASHGFWGTVDKNIANHPTVVAQASLSYLQGFENSGQVGVLGWEQFKEEDQTFHSGGVGANWWEAYGVKKITNCSRVTFLVWCSTNTDEVHGSGLVFIFT
jgi:hypothetical protein